MAHFGNGVMRRSLAHFLGMGGMGLYNLRIHHDLKVARLDPTAPAKIPTAFQNSPAFTNHLHLARINELAKQAGLTTNVHEDVEILHPDNGGRLFSEYLEEQK